MLSLVHCGLIEHCVLLSCGVCSVCWCDHAKKKKTIAWFKNLYNNPLRTLSSYIGVDNMIIYKRLNMGNIPKALERYVYSSNISKITPSDMLEC